MEAARKIGVTVQTYRRRKASGLKWCTLGKHWADICLFHIDRSRGDGLAAKCKACSRDRYKASYVKTPRPPPGRRYAPAREGDKHQARRRVNYLIDIGLLPHPSDCPCVDCGDTDGASRHEYDHHKGYGAEFHETVEAVCAKCHHQRERNRG